MFNILGHIPQIISPLMNIIIHLTNPTKTPTVEQYGSWKSPISSALTVAKSIEIKQLEVDSDKNFSDDIYWVEIRPGENGRYVICSSDPDGRVITEWTPADFSAKSMVHTYGGGHFIVNKGVVYFSNHKDQAIYRQTSPSARPEPLTDPSKKYRYANGHYSAKTNLLYYVKEDHEVIDGKYYKKPLNTLVVINPEDKTEKMLVRGESFYSNPVVSPDGKFIMWMQWNHPKMPWDTTSIIRANLTESGDAVDLKSWTKLAGGLDYVKKKGVSVMQPAWTTQGEVMYIGDQSNWWNLYLRAKDGSHRNLREISKEIGGPQWELGEQNFDMDPKGGPLIATTYGGELGILNTNDGSYEKIETGFSSHQKLQWTNAGIYMKASSPTKFHQIIRYETNTKTIKVIKVSANPPLDESYFSVPERLTWTTTGGEVSHGLFYKPKNRDFVGKEGALPPLLVRAHGGPTAAYSSDLTLGTQYWTSRGFAILHVDYRGSTGYGRRYRNSLYGKWGVSDVQDCISGVQYLVKEGLVDSTRVAIDGKSAGGFTTLAALVSTDVFKAGVSAYGISDMALLVHDTHKFESFYAQNLAVPQGATFDEAFNKKLSPIFHIDKFTSPVGFFQGAKDKIVPPNQSQKMYDAVKAKGLPTFYQLFEDEGHRFVKAENLQLVLDGEFNFFSKVFGFTPADKFDESKLPIIDNLK